MIKQSKSVYIIGSIVIGIITIIAILAGLMLSGIIDASSKKLVYKSMSEEKVYDGETLICDEYALEEGQLKEGHVAEFTFIGEQTEVGESDNAFVVTILDENGADVTSDYEIVTQFGKLSVLPRPLTVKSGDAVEEYNGSVVKNEEVKLTSGELMQGHSIEYVVTGSRVDAGVTENTFVAIVRDESGRDVTKNYKIEYTYGKLEVLPMEVAIVSADKNVTYDGVGYDSTNDFWKYANPEKRPAEGLEVIVIFSGSLDDVGETEKKLASAVVKDNGRDVSFNYKFTYPGGKITVTKIQITIATFGDTKVYDGTPLTVDGLFVVDGTLLDGHYLSDEYVITGSQTEIGSSLNTVDEATVDIVDENGESVKKYYEITYQLGNLEVTGDEERENKDVVDTPPDEPLDDDQLNTVVAKVTANHDGYLYLRRESFLNYTGNSNWTSAENVVYNGLLDNKYSMNYLVGAGIDNGKYITRNQAKIEVLYKNVGYILPYYQSTIQPNIYEIQTNDVYNQGNLASAYYPNYYDTDYNNLYEGNLGGYLDEELLYREFVKRTYRDLNDQITRNRCIEIATWKNWIYSQKTTVEKITEISEYVKSLAKYDINSNLENVTNNIVLALLDNPDNNYKYTALCRHYASVGVALLRTIGIPARYTTGYLANVKNGEEVEVTVGDGHAWVEAYIDGIGWVYVECTPSAENPEDGEVVNKKQVTLTPQDVSMRYYEGIEPEINAGINTSKDFDTFKKQGYTITAEVILVPNQEINSYGIYQTMIDLDSVVIKDPEGNEVNDFHVITKTGKLHLYVYELAVKTFDAEKVYDGQPLRYSDIFEDEGYQLAGDVFSNYDYKVELTGSTSKVGQVSNTVKVKVYEKGTTNDVTDMFKISKQYGKLTVKLKPITLQAGSLEEIYESGKVLTIDKNNYEIVLGELVTGHKIIAEVKGSLSTPGYSYTYFSSVKIVDMNNRGEDVTSQYEITLIEGQLYMSFA